MKLHPYPILLAALLLLCPCQTHAQDKPSAAETVERLQLQLIDLQAKEENLKTRAQQLDEDLKPENIEHALAGVGSTKPDELREHRRRQLTAERTSVTAQLEEVTAQRSRLQAALASAEAEAYHESANGPAVENEMSGTESMLSSRWLLLGALVMILGISISLMMVLKRRTSAERIDN